jgi:hypothetical protein
MLLLNVRERAQLLGGIAQELRERRIGISLRAVEERARQHHRVALLGEERRTAKDGLVLRGVARRRVPEVDRARALAGAQEVAAEVGGDRDREVHQHARGVALGDHRVAAPHREVVALDQVPGRAVGEQGAVAGERLERIADGGLREHQVAHQLQRVIGRERARAEAERRIVRERHRALDQPAGLLEAEHSAHVLEPRGIDVAALEQGRHVEPTAGDFTEQTACYEDGDTHDIPSECMCNAVIGTTAG